MLSINDVKVETRLTPSVGFFSFKITKGQLILQCLFSVIVSTKILLRNQVRVVAFSLPQLTQASTLTWLLTVTDTLRGNVPKVIQSILAPNNWPSKT